MKSSYLKALDNFGKREETRTFFKPEKRARTPKERLDAFQAAANLKAAVKAEVETKLKKAETARSKWVNFVPPIRFEGFVDSVKIEVKPEPEPLHDGPRWRECVCARCAQSRALRALWQSVADNLEFRHPDPKVEVAVDVFGEYATDRYARIRFHMRNLVDTDDSERVRRMPNHFHMLLVTSTWPGREAAELTMLGAWTTYLRHEAMELVERRDRVGYLETNSYAPQKKAPWHPHTAHAITAHVQDVITCCFHGYGAKGDLVKIAGSVVGDVQALRTWDEGAPRARRELEAEVDHQLGNVAVDQ